MMQFFSNTFKDNIAQVPAVIDVTLLKPFKLSMALRVIVGGMAETSCRIASFNCSVVPGRRPFMAFSRANVAFILYENVSSISCSKLLTQ